MNMIYAAKPMALTFSQGDGWVRVPAGLRLADAVDGRDLEAVDGVGLQQGHLVAGRRRVGEHLLLQVLEIRLLVSLHRAPPIKKSFDRKPKRGKKTDVKFFLSTSSNFFSLSLQI